MKLSEIYEIANTLAPKALSDEMCAKYGFYDNSGILVDVGEEITGIVFSLDLSDGAIALAMAKGANLIITHHPAIYGKISKIDYFDEGNLGKKLVWCLRKGISVLSMHLNLDSAKEGIDESLAQGITLAAGSKQRQKEQIQCLLSSGGYGRVYDVGEVPLFSLAEGIKSTFDTKRIEVYGDMTKRVKRVASFCGAGADEGTVAFAVDAGAEVMISSDFKHHILALALEKGLSVIALTHYASENYGFRKYYEKISRQVKLPCDFYTEENLL